MIYDFGANNGVNLEYYLSKDRVVAVEANPALCDEMRERFVSEVKSGRLTIVNAALGEYEGPRPLIFWVHKTNHVLSRLPSPANLDEFTTVGVQGRTPANIIAEHGPPSYVKIDVEHSDEIILRNIFAAGIFPPEVSAEAHSIGVFALMVANGYQSFALVEGCSVAKRYPGFREHSAGPFGSDIKGPWQCADTFFCTLAAEGLGWKDIHATLAKGDTEHVSGQSLIARQLRLLSSRAAKGIARRAEARFR